MANPTHVTVIGAGPGGYPAAFLAADLGMQVTLVDEEKNPGGVCVYRGCIPSKALLHVAKVLDEARHASQFGVEFAAPRVDLDKLRAFKDGVVIEDDRRHRRADALAQDPLRAGPRDASSIRTTISVALTGGGGRDDHASTSASSPPARGRRRCRTCRSAPIACSTRPRALELKSVPKSLLVIGGGYIGLELGSVYAALGTKVSVVEMLPGLLPGADRDLVKILAERIGQICETGDARDQGREDGRRRRTA